ncbi:MAG: hypothetical protein NT154_18110 [Verrucomicrobia bacterium]|nr:hypothetical protein [Verrucomicrobiota bacterium]
MRAGFVPGTATDFNSLNLINGSSGYFFPSDPHAPPATTLQITHPDVNGHFTISGVTGAGRTVVLWKSMDLSLGASGWLPVETNTVGGAFSFALTNAPDAKAFYRVK